MDINCFLPKGGYPREHISSLISLPVGPIVEVRAPVEFKMQALAAPHPHQTQVSKLEIQCTVLAGVWPMPTGCSLQV